jgi:dipeptidyl aminopeptidase/acylaminoacyl peptidase
MLAQVPEADKARIGIFGGSRGGMMAYRALTRTTRFKAAVIRSGLSDAFATAADRPDMEKGFAELMPGYAANRDSVLLMRSPVRWAERLCKTTPILIEAGTGDWRVKADQPLAMAQALYACKHPFRMLMLEGADHYLSEYRDEVDHASRLFLDTYVRDGKPWPSLKPHGE